MSDCPNLYHHNEVVDLRSKVSDLTRQLEQIDAEREESRKANCATHCMFCGAAWNINTPIQHPEAHRPQCQIKQLSEAKKEVERLKEESVKSELWNIDMETKLAASELAAKKLREALTEYHDIPCAQERIHRSNSAACGPCPICAVLSLALSHSILAAHDADVRREAIEECIQTAIGDRKSVV